MPTARRRQRARRSVCCIRYTDRPQLLHRMSRLAREELRHFEQVLS
jgi:tRNA isopentenyl-2-thiomethyl-A-37 hydroxylase MiaE